MNVRTKYKVLIDIMIKLKDVFHPDNFEEFMNYYENENNLTEFRKLVNIPPWRSHHIRTIRAMLFH